MKQQLLIFFIVSICSISFAQNKTLKDTNRSNAFYSSAIFVGQTGGLGINYERFLIQRNQKVFNAITGTICIGGFSDGNFYGCSRLTAFIGRSRNYFEFGWGVTIFYDRDQYSTDKQQSQFNGSEPIKKDYVGLWPAMAIGYRYQEENKPTLFRFGIGYPEMLYMSVGFKF